MRKDKIIKSLGKFNKIIIIPLLFLLPFVCLAQESRIAEFSDSGWALYQNNEAGYCLSLPLELGVYLRNRKDMKQAAEEMLPFDYVNFRPKEASSGFVFFELGVGVHWNRDNLGTREFADRKDVGLRMSGAHIQILRQCNVTVAGIQGVQDDFRISKPDGWRSYCRIIIPFGDKFYVFLGTLGGEAPVPEYERVFHRIINSFELFKNP